MRSALASCVVLVGCLACRAQHSPPPVASISVGSAIPVDRLAPDELKPGQLEAMGGLYLPSGLQIDQRLDNAVYASGNLSASVVLDYLRRRVLAGQVELVGSRTVFSRARIREGRPDREYEITVIQEPNRIGLKIRDVTPKPAAPGLSEEQRWKMAGLSPSGHLLDVNQYK